MGEGAKFRAMSTDGAVIDIAVEEILAESDAKLWAGLEARVDARIRERDRKLAARLREAASTRLRIGDTQVGRVLNDIVEILEADDG